jgi:hypothetical protein
MNGDESHWYGEIVDGIIGSMTLIQSLDNDQISRLSGYVFLLLSTHVALFTLFTLQFFLKNRTATVGNNLYSIMSSIDGSILVNTMNATDFPMEKDDDSVAIETSSNHRQLRGSIQKSRNLGGADDGSVLDVLCMYTLQTVCQEAILGGFIQGSDCNRTTFTKYKYLMDAKCQLAVAQSVRFSSTPL